MLSTNIREIRHNDWRHCTPVFVQTIHLKPFFKQSRRSFTIEIIQRRVNVCDEKIRITRLCSCTLPDTNLKRGVDVNAVYSVEFSSRTKRASKVKPRAPARRTSSSPSTHFPPLFPATTTLYINRNAFALWRSYASSMRFAHPPPSLRSYYRATEIMINFCAPPAPRAPTVFLTVNVRLRPLCSVQRTNNKPSPRWRIRGPSVWRTR